MRELTLNIFIQKQIIKNIKDIVLSGEWMK